MNAMAKKMPPLARTPEELRAAILRLAEAHGWIDGRSLGFSAAARLLGVDLSTLQRQIGGDASRPLPVNSTLARLVWTMERDPRLVNALTAALMDEAKRRDAA